MELQVTSKNVELSSEVRHYLEHKLGKLSRHLPNIMDYKVELFEEKTKARQQHFVVRVVMDCKGTLLRGEERGQDLFTAIDKVATIMDRQIQHYKGKLYEKGRGSSFARGKFEEGIETTQPGKVVRVKRFAVKPMLVTEAIDQMELLGHDFFLFFNDDSGELNLLYRRKDSNYGLIEPELE